MDCAVARLRVWGIASIGHARHLPNAYFDSTRLWNLHESDSSRVAFAVGGFQSFLNSIGTHHLRLVARIRCGPWGSSSCRRSGKPPVPDVAQRRSYGAMRRTNAALPRQRAGIWAVMAVVKTLTNLLPATYCQAVRYACSKLDGRAGHPGEMRNPLWKTVRAVV